MTENNPLKRKIKSLISNLFQYQMLNLLVISSFQLFLLFRVIDNDSLEHCTVEFRGLSISVKMLLRLGHSVFFCHTIHDAVCACTSWFGLGLL